MAYVRRCVFIHVMWSHVFTSTSKQMFEMTKLRNEHATHNNRHQLNEIELMCSVLMEDSEWLDSYQNNVLENDMEKIHRITILNDINDSVASTSKQPQPEEHKQNLQGANQIDVKEKCCESRRKQCPQSQLPSISEFNDLPAPEFVFGSRSFVASESVRLIRRAANESSSRKKNVNHTILFKKPSA